MNYLTKHFEKMGARLKVHDLGDFSIDIRRDKDGEYFFIRGTEFMDRVEVVNLDKKDRHLLLMAKSDTGDVSHILCGHDETHWFTCAVPNRPTTVRQAKENLKPDAVVDRERKMRVSGVQKGKRHNAARKRQGEWFFVPIWHKLNENKMAILKNEPIQRGGGGKPHMCEFVYRTGGEAVWVSREHPNGLNDKAYRKLIRKDPSKKRLGWRRMVRDAEVYAKGKIRHSDHKTLHLDGWHRVYMNTENEAPGARQIAFLD